MRLICITFIATYILGAPALVAADSTKRPFAQSKTAKLCFGLIVGTFQVDALTLDSLQEDDPKGMAYEIRNKRDRLAIAEILTNTLGKKLDMEEDFYSSAYVEIFESGVWGEIPESIKEITYEELTTNISLLSSNSDEHIEGVYIVEGYALHFQVRKTGENSRKFYFANVVTGDVILEGEFQENLDIN